MQLITLSPEQITEHQKWIKHFEEKYNFKFFKPSFEEVPFVSPLFEDERVSRRVAGLEYYLLGTYPIDMGTNSHQEMRNLRYQFSEEEYLWHQKHNKLGINCWGIHAGAVLVALNRALEREDLNAGILLPSADEYSVMSFGQKLRFCASIDNRLYALLEKLNTLYGKDLTFK